jgi:hypothetical protein
MAASKIAALYNLDLDNGTCNSQSNPTCEDTKLLVWRMRNELSASPYVHWKFEM